MAYNITDNNKYKKLYQESIENPEKFWENEANSFYWQKKWDSVLEGDFTQANVQWFSGAKLNITENCLDRHLEKRANKTAVIFEPNQPDSIRQTLTYKELHEEVCKFSNVLEKLGIQKGDRICFYMSMAPELLIGVLASARIGAIHSVVFAGFSAESLAGRIQDSECKLLITCDGVFRGEKHIDLKGISDKALNTCPSIEKVIVLKRSFAKINMVEDRDFWWHQLIKHSSPIHNAVTMDAEDPLFILYTSGSTGKPKGVVHTTAGYMVYAAYSFRNVFQIKEDSVYWCTADIGWITGHSYITYGPLLNGATTLMFEGVPTYPDPGRFWQIVDKYKVSHFYTAPTAIRALQAFGDDVVNQYDLTSLKVLGTVGEPINEEAWHWYDKVVGKGKCPIVDTWWQTETGGIMISPLAGITNLKPGFATFPLPGVQPVLMDANGNEIGGNDVEGNLCIKFPWPSVTRTVYGDHERYKNTYFSQYKGYYFTGDGCRRDKDGYYRITGRVDDVLNVSGHRLGTAEIENAINEHKEVVESAVVGFPHDIKGQGIFAYIITYSDIQDQIRFDDEIKDIIIKKIGGDCKT